MTALDEINEDWQINGLSPTWAKLHQAKQEQVALIAERDALREELERIKALKPFGYWHQGDSDDESDFFLAGQSGPVGQGCPQCIALYALGSKTHE